MNRNKKIVVYSVIIIALVFSYLRLIDRYITSEKAFYAAERGNNYGPSYDISVKYSLDDDRYIMIGKHDYGISFNEVRRTMLFLWETGDEPSYPGNIPFDDMEDNLYVTMVAYGNYDKSFVWGYSKNEDVKTIRCNIEESDNKYITGEVSESGIFFIPIGGAFEYSIKNFEGLDVNGNVIEEFEF